MWVVSSGVGSSSLQNWVRLRPIRSLRQRPGCGSGAFPFRCEPAHNFSSSGSDQRFSFELGPKRGVKSPAAARAFERDWRPQGKSGRMHLNPLNGAFCNEFQPFAVPASEGSFCPRLWKNA